MRALHAAGYEVWLAINSGQQTYAQRSRAAAGTVQVTSPGVSAERHAHEMAHAAARLKVAAVLPGTEASLASLTGRQDLFSPGVGVAVTPPEVLRRATDKALLGELAQRVGLQTPEAIQLEGGEGDDLVEVPFPAIVKPVSTVGGGGSLIQRRRQTALVRTPVELRRALAAAPGVSCLVQPYVPGTLAAICGVAWEGELICSEHQRSPRIWPPSHGVSSYATTVPPDPARDAAVAELVRAIGWSGVFGVQFLLQGERAQVIDFNPRLYGSLALAVAAGLNLPAIWADLVLGRPISKPGSYRVGVRYRVEEDDPRALLAAFRRGERVAALQGLVPRRHTAHAVFSWRDPRPSLLTLAKLGRGLRSAGRRPG